MYVLWMVDFGNNFNFCSLKLFHMLNCRRFSFSFQLLCKQQFNLWINPRKINLYFLLYVLWITRLTENQKFLSIFQPTHSPIYIKMLFISSYNALTPEIFQNVIDRMVTGMMVRDRIVATSPLDIYLVNMVNYLFSLSTSWQRNFKNVP